MEGQVFACSWKKQGKLYKVWVKRRPRLSAEGKTFDQADERLWAMIIDATGDGESIREYDPPAPESDPPKTVASPAVADATSSIEKLVSCATRKRRKPEPLKTNAQVQRQFALRVGEHFAFLRELGLKPPKFTSESDPDTGMSWKARFGSGKRTLDIVLSKAYKDFDNSIGFTINPKPVENPWEALLGFMYIKLKYGSLADTLEDIARTYTLDETMGLAFPFFADLFQGELRPILTGEKWHHGYKFHRDS